MKKSLLTAEILALFGDTNVTKVPSGKRTLTGNQIKHAVRGTQPPVVTPLVKRKHGTLTLKLGAR